MREEKRGDNDYMGRKASKRCQEATVGRVHPWEAGGGKTQVTLTKRQQGDTIVPDHSCGPPLSPFLSNAEE